MKSRSKNNIALGVAGLICGASVLCAGMGISKTIESDKLQADVDKKIKNISISQQYIEHKRQYSDSLYQQYRNGEISVEEYKDRLDELNSYEHIKENKQLFISNEESEKLDDLNAKATKKNEEASLNIVEAVGLALVGGCSVGACLWYKMEEEENSNGGMCL